MIAKRPRFDSVGRSQIVFSPKREWIHFDDLSGDLSVRPSARPLEGGQVFSGRLLGDEFDLAVDTSDLVVFRRALAPLSEETLLSPEIAEDVIAAMVERFVLGRLSASARESFSLSPREKPTTPSVSRFGFDMRWGQLATSFAISARGSLESLLHRFVREAPIVRNGTSATVLMPVDLVIASYAISRSQLATLETEDTIVCCTPIAQAHSFCHLVTYERQLYLARYQAEQITVLGPRTDSTRTEEHLMVEHQGAFAPVTDISEIPLTLRFSAGQIELTVRELETIQPGHVFPMPGRTPADVDMMVNGRKIGRAEIVEIDGMAGFRITEVVGSRGS